MTPLPIYARRIIVPAHLGLVLCWDSPRTRLAAKHAPFVPALAPVHVLN